MDEAANLFNIAEENMSAFRDALETLRKRQDEDKEGLELFGAQELGESGRIVENIASIMGTELPVSPLLRQFYEFAWGWTNAEWGYRWFSPDEMATALNNPCYRERVMFDVHDSPFPPGPGTNIYKTALMGFQLEDIGHHTYFYWDKDVAEEPSVLAYGYDYERFNNLSDYILALLEREKE
jgi:hypothetical protein